MAKIEIPVKVYMGIWENVIDELKHLQTYKLCENDDMCLVDVEDVAKILVNHIKVEQEPERKRGKWISFGKVCNCNVCHKGYDNKDGFIEEWNYCPNCGAKNERL